MTDVQIPISRLFSHLREEVSKPSDRPVHYLQSQNGNLADEYKPLLDDVGIEGPFWAREAFGESPLPLLSVPSELKTRTLGQSPDVANIWIGGVRSKTSMHKGASSPQSNWALDLTSTYRSL